MKSLKLTVILFAALLMAGCATTVPLNQKFYNTKKVGVIVLVDSIGIAKEGAQGLLDMAMTPGDKYRAPLNTIAPKVNPKSLLLNEISSILQSKNKAFVVLPDNVVDQNLAKFEAPESSDLKYYKRDFRAIKAKHNVDEVLYVRVKYGILVSYYSMVEIGREGYTMLNANIIDLDDNSLLSQYTIRAKAPLKGKWNEAPEYTNLKNAIQLAINKSAESLKTKF